MSLKPMYVWSGSEWVQIGDASTPQTTINIEQQAPEGAVVGSIWYDDEAGGLYVYDGEFWVSISGPRGPQGPSGATGPQGEQGPQGDPADVLTASTAIVSAIVDGAPVALDTLNEIAAALQDNPDVLDLYLTQVSASNTYLTQASASSTYVTPSSSNTLTNKILTSPTINDALIYEPTIQTPKENIQVWNSAISSTQEVYLSLGSVHYFNSNATTNWTTNVTFNESTTINSFLSNGQSVSFVILVQNGGTAYYQTGFQIDGSTQGVTVEWQGGSAPTEGNINSIDAYSITIVKTSSGTYTVLASLTQFA